MERGRWAWFVAGALFVVVFPWLLAREWRWRRAFAGVLTLLVAYRAVEVARIAARSRGDTVSALGLDVPTQVGAWAFCLLAVGTAAMLARAAWSRKP